MYAVNMPKQVGNVTKATRMLQVYEVLKRKGRCTAEDIANAVALSLSIDTDDKNFRRTIYRDLKEFAQDNTIQVDYYTPDGKQIEAGQEDQFKNVRAEYYLTGGESLVLGGGLVTDLGGSFVPAKPGVVEWQFRDVSKGFVPEMIHFVFASVRSPFTALCLPHDEAPAKVLIGRQARPGTYTPNPSDIEKAYGRRSAFFYYPEKTLSRPKENGPDGHGIIEFLSEKEAHIKDLGSSTGSYWAVADGEEFSQSWANVNNDSTFEVTLHPLRANRDWQPIPEGGLKVEFPVFCKFGDFAFYLCFIDK